MSFSVSSSNFPSFFIYDLRKTLNVVVCQRLKCSRESGKVGLVGDRFDFPFLAPLGQKCIQFLTPRVCSPKISNTFSDQKNTTISGAK